MPLNVSSIEVSKTDMTVQSTRIVENFTVPVTPSLCIVSHKHISEMYDHYDSGLCDQSTSNAVALSLSEMTGEKVRVFRRNNQAFCKTSAGVHKLPDVVYRWLVDADSGVSVRPFRFFANLENP